ncbi:unnamed protein product [Mytilus coruscus]|uniref:Uncharacterized protein n=1 Tax=Mytilus coruscus TaxID=42192 RepID=A0A6J8AQ37_MYTCO|nr:unnamed protein product [Mytilus coruscus]
MYERRQKGRPLEIIHGLNGREHREGPTDWTDIIPMVPQQEQHSSLWRSTENQQRDERVRVYVRHNRPLASKVKFCRWTDKYHQIVSRSHRSRGDHRIFRLHQFVSDPIKDVRDFHIVSDEIVQLEYLDDPQFLPMDFKTNVFVATFTTCWARLKLYDLLMLTGESALYVDTDSIIFVDKDKAITNKLPIGNLLGELTNEIPKEDGHITHFVSSGPKSYAYRTLSGKEVCKVRGFSLESESNSRLINFSTMKDIVVNKTKKTIKVVNSRKISRLGIKRKLYNKIEEKEFKMVYTKRRLLDDLRTLPFGYSD